LIRQKSPEVAERRAQARRACVDSGARAVLASQGQDLWQASVRDISAGGIGVLLDRRVDPGTVLAIELHNKTQHFWHLKLLRVIHATPQGQHWLVGSAFLKSFTDAEFNSLFD
jgi:hypothetical protein